MDDDEVNRLRIALGRISRLVDRQVSGDGMTRTTLSLLGTIARRGDLGMSELADVEGLNPTMASRLVGKLEDAGLVRRRPGDEDRRAVVVEITPAGRRMHTRLKAERTALVTDRLAGIPARHRDALLRAVPALELLAESLRQPDRAAPRSPAGAGARS